MPTTIYTDGSCIRNGRPGAQAGFGVYWPTDPEYTMSGKVLGEVQTSNAAELIGVLMALNSVAMLSVKGRFDDYIVYTDSDYAYRCLTEYLPKWQSNNWRTAKNKPVQNRALIERILELIYCAQDHHCNIELELCPSHVSGPEGAGNAAADKLARQGSSGEGLWTYNPETAALVRLHPAKSTAYVWGGSQGSRSGGCVMFYDDGTNRTRLARIGSHMQSETMQYAAVDFALSTALSSRDPPNLLVLQSVTVLRDVIHVRDSWDLFSQSLFGIPVCLRAVLERIHFDFCALKEKSIHIDLTIPESYEDEDSMSAARYEAGLAEWQESEYPVCTYTL